VTHNRQVKDLQARMEDDLKPMTDRGTFDIHEPFALHKHKSQAMLGICDQAALTSGTNSSAMLGVGVSLKFEPASELLHTGEGRTCRRGWRTT